MASNTQERLFYCASEKWDWKYGFKFSTYYISSVRKTIFRQLKDSFRSRAVSLDCSYGEDERNNLLSIFGVEGSNGEIDSAEHRNELMAGFYSILSHRERIILDRRFGLNDGGKASTLEEVGKIVGLTRERVRQIQNEILKKIKGYLDGRELALTYLL